MADLGVLDCARKHEGLLLRELTILQAEDPQVGVGGARSRGYHVIDQLCVVFEEPADTHVRGLLALDAETDTFVARRAL